MFELTEPQKMVQDMFRAYCKKEIQPHVHDMEDGKKSPFDLSRKMMDLLGGSAMIKKPLEKLAAKREEGAKSGANLVELMSGGEEGGMGDDPMMMMIMIKELSRVSPGMAMSFGVSMALAGGAIVAKGTARQIREFAIPVMTQEKIGAWCLTEPDAGSDAFGSMKSTAKPTDDGGYIINGTKTFITNGPLADVFVIYAKINRGQPAAERQVHTFILERGMKGLTTGEPFEKMGMKDSPTCEVFMEDVKLEKKHLLGEQEESAGRKGAKESLGNERSGVPAMCWGIIERCYDECIEYVKVREQFGKPIGEFQATQLKIYRMYMYLKNVENIVFRTSYMQKNGIKDISFINASKAYASTAAVEVANDAIQIFGGYGYMREYPVEKMFRDAKLLELGAGTTDINMLTCARSELDLL